MFWFGKIFILPYYRNTFVEKCFFAEFVFLFGDMVLSCLKHQLLYSWIRILLLEKLLDHDFDE